MSDQSSLTTEKAGKTEPEAPFLVSNAMMLSLRQLAGLGLFATVLVLLLPAAWKRLEPLDREDDYRVPYDLSNDYWLFERVARDAADRYETLIVGDSVVWGQYVTREQTLSHHLNQQAGQERFANLGVDGLHPAALAGLIEYHAECIAGKEVILHLNPLWVSSTKHDLTGEKEFPFNHPGLVPQFFPRIPCYQQEVSRRLGLVVERNLPFYQWTSHLQLAYIDRTSLPEWTLEHPYSSPLKLLSFRLPPSDNRLHHRPVSWTEQGIRKQDFEWVELDRSFQWRSFRRALEILQERENHVLVVVGPLNEHMLTDSGQLGYSTVREGMVAWLRERRIDHYVPPALPSDLYADASHPLGEGYRMLAAQILARLPWK